VTLLTLVYLTDPLQDGSTLSSTYSVRDCDFLHTLSNSRKSVLYPCLESVLVAALIWDLTTCLLYCKTVKDGTVEV
jgi:hypothetical protein